MTNCVKKCVKITVLWLIVKTKISMLEFLTSYSGKEFHIRHSNSKKKGIVEFEHDSP